jgi:hypothetical protein
MMLRVESSTIEMYEVLGMLYGPKMRKKFGNPCTAKPRYAW